MEIFSKSRNCAIFKKTSSCPEFSALSNGPNVTLGTFYVTFGPFQHAVAPRFSNARIAMAILLVVSSGLYFPADPQCNFMIKLVVPGMAKVSENWQSKVSMHCDLAYKVPVIANFPMLRKHCCPGFGIFRTVKRNSTNLVEHLLRCRITNQFWQ